MKKNTKQNRGFTLIETLVAISILMIAIAGPLTIANKAYTSAAEAKNQSIATNLTQEAMELINYYKDNRTGIFAGWSTNSPDVPPVFHNCVTASSNCLFDSVPVPTTPTLFTRYYYFTDEKGAEVTKATNQVIANVEVSWNTGSLFNKIKLQSVLTNYDR